LNRGTPPFPERAEPHDLYKRAEPWGGNRHRRLYLALQKRPALTIPEFLAEEETLYRVLVPRRKTSTSRSFIRGWSGKNRRDNGEAGGVVQPRGVPLKIQPAGEPVSERSCLT